MDTDFPQSFIFKMPMGSTAEPSGVDLKWLGEQFEMISSLMKQFTDSYNSLVASQNHPAELLRAQFKIIEALANYQIGLLEQQRKRQGFIQSESELQEMMSQLDQFVKNFKDNK